MPTDATYCNDFFCSSPSCVNINLPFFASWTFFLNIIQRAETKGMKTILHVKNSIFQSLQKFAELARFEHAKSIMRRSEFGHGDKV